MAIYFCRRCCRRAYHSHRAIPVIVVMALSLTLPRASGLAAVGPTVAAQPVSPPTNNWVANCSVPWMPECVEATPPADLGRLLR